MLFASTKSLDCWRGRCGHKAAIGRHPHEVCAHVRDLIAQKLAVVGTKIAELQKMEAQLAGALRQCRTALRRRSKHQDSCPVLEAITKPQPRRKKS